MTACRREEGAAYDAVIIGAGIGGLTAAFLLARAGMKTAVFEHHTAVGGYCATFRRQGYLFDAAAHCISSVGNDRTPVGKLFGNLGVEYLPSGRQNLYLGDRRYTWSYDVRQLGDVLKTSFPTEAERIDAFLATTRKIYLGYSSRGLGSPVCEKYRHATYQELLESYFSNRELMALLSFTWSFAGLPPDRISALAMSILFHELFNNGVCQIKGGTQQLSNRLADETRKAGGVVLTRSKITSIMLQNHRAIGVETAKGERIRSQYVISNCDARQTFGQLIGAGNVDPGFWRQLSAMTESAPSSMVYLGVDIDDETAERIHGFHFSGNDMNNGDNYPLTVAVPTLKDPGLAPPGKHVVIAQALFSFATAIAQERTKSHYTDIIIDRIQDRLNAGGNSRIDFRSRIAVTDSADAKTLYRYTLNSEGASYGWAKTPSQFLFDHGNDHRIENLHQVGHWTSYGFGVSGSMYSAIRVVRSILPSTIPPEGIEREGQSVMSG